MNFHHQHVPAEPAPANGPRYEPFYSRDSSGRANVFERLTALAGAPLFGSRWIFPRRFDHAFVRLNGDPAAPADVIPEHAIWYFGQSLHLDVDPLSLKRRISDWVRGPRGIRWIGTSFLDAADWSAAIKPLDNSPIHREMHEIAKADGNLSDTRAYRRLMRAIRLGRPARRNNVELTNEEAITAYLRYCRDLTKSMRKRGAVRHSESGAFHRLRFKHRDVRSPVHDSTERDIGVAITADGELIRHLGGKHRTAIAQALKLPRVPVEIRMVHTSWLARQVQKTGLPPHLALRDGVRLFVAKSNAATAA